MGAFDHVAVASESPDTDRAQQILRAYLEDVAGRYYGRPATADEIRVALSEIPKEDLAPPAGILLLARTDQRALGCVGLRFVGDRAGEITRLFVVGEARGHGLATRLMDAVEGRARDRGLERVRLDTRTDLIEARRLYARRGYREVAPFNDGPYAEHWFEKTLV